MECLRCNIGRYSLVKIIRPDDDDDDDDEFRSLLFNLVSQLRIEPLQTDFGFDFAGQPNETLDVLPF